ncbi:prolyl aminopeptidase [Tropicimonas sediminicola]|uniref:Proline iminopeptidase n=1 Tax=Tropicimonas sediminicola TaxID=1031541 RepID=A0A239L3G5_9RHOB|nr:prolyl aminopeptidase [Tropicimonas sediminicola]SNT24363.1 proline iminopeptidase [Tropicimonas sediminicola]
MDRVADHKSAQDFLYPSLAPFDQRMMDVGDGHKIYVEQCGDPEGVPVVVLHGGPGGGCSPAMRRFFDPEGYRIILFDQRGCGRSRPHASIEANTTWHLVADIERIREALGIERWVVFGGSWGATLGLVYAQAHPDRVAYLVLRGVFLMMQEELDWFYGGGAGKFFPENWRRFTGLLPEDERDDVIEAYGRRLFGPDRAVQTRFARAWASWENALAAMSHDGPGHDSPPDYARAFSRLENHYFRHLGWLERDGRILEDMPLISHIPGTVVQGRYDMICPPASAWKLTERWSRGELRMVSMAGHALTEPGITSELVRVTDSVLRTAGRLGF